MKLGHLAIVNRSVAEREQLLKMIESGSIGTTIVFAGTVWSDEAVDALVKPLVVGELRARLRRIEAALETMGVTLN